MADVNKVLLSGNLGQDPKTGQTSRGDAYTTASLATKESYVNREGQEVTQTTWHYLVAWRRVAELMANFKKGDHLDLEGKIVKRSYQDKNGETKYVTEVEVRGISVAASREQPVRKQAEPFPSPVASTSSQDTASMGAASTDDEIPF